MPGALHTLTSHLRRLEPYTLAALTALLAISIVSSPLMAHHTEIGNVLISASVLTAVAVIATSPVRLVVACLLGAVKLLDIWLDPTHTGAIVLIAGDTLLALLVVRVLGIVYQRARPTPIRLTAAVAGYLMGIILFAGLHARVLADNPAAIRGLDPATEIGQADVVYFSAVTQTTLGYGDMTPTAPAAKSLVMTQSILGVLYVAITIAGLVGSHEDSENPPPTA